MRLFHAPPSSNRRELLLFRPNAHDTRQSGSENATALFKHSGRPQDQLRIERRKVETVSPFFRREGMIAQQRVHLAAGIRLSEPERIVVQPRPQAAPPGNNKNDACTGRANAPKLTHLVFGIENVLETVDSNNEIHSRIGERHFQRIAKHGV